MMNNNTISDVLDEFFRLADKTDEINMIMMIANLTDVWKVSFFEIFDFFFSPVACCMHPSVFPFIIFYPNINCQ